MTYNYELMTDIEARYRKASGLSDRAYYSIFYGPLCKSSIIMINANPGGRPDKYKIVDTAIGEHEYIEGVASGPTTRNGAEILSAIVGPTNIESLRRVQVLNRFFRRSPQRPSVVTEAAYMAEARPFLQELICYIEPKALLFGGDAGVKLFADAHNAKVKPVGTAIKGPNGSNEATYFAEYRVDLPYLGGVAAYGIYHPSKMNQAFRNRVIPILVEKLGPLVD